MAQAVAHLIGSEEVPGPSPGVSSFPGSLDFIEVPGFFNALIEGPKNGLILANGYTLVTLPMMVSLSLEIKKTAVRPPGSAAAVAYFCIILIF